MHNDEKNTFRSTNNLKDYHHKNSPSNASNDQLLQAGLNIKQFSYLSPNDNRHSFSFTKETINQSYYLSALKDKYKLIIASIIPEDSGAESSDLNQTIESVVKSIEALSSFNITCSSLLYIVFMQNIQKQEHYNHFFQPNQSLLSTKTNNSNDISILNTKAFQASLMAYSNNSLSTIQVLLLHKPKLKEIESLNCLYNDILPQLWTKDNIIHLVQIANGVVLSPDSLNEMITISATQSPVIVPCLETIPIGFFAQIEHYANYQYNVFNMNYYMMNRCLPINHLMSLIRIDELVYEDISNYFNMRINLDADVHYHDYLFSLYLTERNYKIIYAKQIRCSIKRNQITFGQMMNYQTHKMSGTYSSVLNLISFWLKGEMVHVSIANKLSLMLFFFGMIFDFLFPSMMSIVIYSILNEAFKLKDPRVVIFLTGLYLLITMLTISFSLISKKNSDKMDKIFFAFYITFTVYYLFLLVCSVPAIHFVNTNPSLDVYQFNIAAFCSIIVINLVFGLIPLLINYKSFFKHIVYGLEYLALGASGFTSVFLNHSIVNASDMIGCIANDKSKAPSDKSIINYYKAVVIGLYSGTNAFFIFILFFLTNRTMRANGVLSLGIIYTIYNSLKVIVVILGMFVGSNSNNNDTSQLTKKTKKTIEPNAIHEYPFPQQFKHEDTNDQQVNNNANGAIGEKDSISLENVSNQNEKRDDSFDMKKNKSRRHWDEDEKEKENENAIKEKSIELDIVDKSDSNPNEEREDNDDGNNDNKEKEISNKKQNTYDNGNDNEDLNNEEENNKKEQIEKEEEEEDNDIDDNDNEQKNKKEDEVNQGSNFSDPKI